MEIDDALNGSLPRGASVVPGSSLDNALEESRKTRVLYQHHREGFHKSAASKPGWVAADMSCGLISKAEQPMHATPFWPDDLSGLSHQAVLNYMAENRAWNKSLRERTVALVNTRLAKTITKEEYDSTRNRTNQDAAECYRRAAMVVRNMAIRERGLLPFIDSSDPLTETASQPQS